MRSDEGQVLGDVGVHPRDVLEAVEAPRDPRLVRHHGDRQAGLVEPGDRLRRPGNELDPVNRADIPVVNDDRAVTIEEDSRPRGWPVSPGHFTTCQ